MSSDAERKSRSHRGLARRLAALRLLALHGTLFVLLILYSLAGAYTFMQIEGPAEAQARADQRGAKELLTATKRQLLNVVHRKVQGSGDAKNWSAQVDKSLVAFEKAFESAVRQGAQVDALPPPKWDFWGSLFYVNTVYTTIGYGNMAPVTTAGRVATIVYATFGIPLFLVLQANLGSLVVSALKKLLRSLANLTAPKSRRKCDHDTEESWPKESDIEALQGFAVLVIVVIISVCYIGLGIGLYRSWEDWTPLEAFYFIFISLTTIGFGDIVPLQPKHFMLSSLYVFLGMTLVSTTFSAIQGAMASQVDAVKVKADSLLGITAVESEPAAEQRKPTDKPGDKASGASAAE